MRPVAVAAQNLSEKRTWHVRWQKLPLALLSFLRREGVERARTPDPSRTFHGPLDSKSSALAYRRDHTAVFLGSPASLREGKSVPARDVVGRRASCGARAVPLWSLWCSTRPPPWSGALPVPPSPCLRSRRTPSRDGTAASTLACSLAREVPQGCQPVAPPRPCSGQGTFPISREVGEPRVAAGSARGSADGASDLAAAYWVASLGDALADVLGAPRTGRVRRGYGLRSGSVGRRVAHVQHPPRYRDLDRRSILALRRC